MGKLNMNLLKGVEEQENAIENSKAYQEEEAFLNLMRQGKSRKEAYEAIGREKTWASKTIKKIRETEPERLKGTGEEPQEQEAAQDIIKVKYATTEEKKEPTVINAVITESPKKEQTPIEYELVKEPPKEPQSSEIRLEKAQPKESTPTAEKAENKANTKPQKAVMGFRADQSKIEVWKLYAEATGQEIGVMCTAAIDEYIENHELTADQKQIFDIKMNALEAERRIKGL